MSTTTPDPEVHLPSANATQRVTIPHRVLACLLCQQRKVRCDRKSPCANCIRSGVHCVPAIKAPRPKRRRFPERELLDRIQLYENLLVDNNIHFVPLCAEKVSPGENRTEPVQPDRLDEKESSITSKTYEPKKFWHALTQRSRESDDDGNDTDDSGFMPDDLRDSVVKKAWDQYNDTNDPLLFGVRKTDLDLSTLHPEQVHIFKLWQIYSDNVNPLLKITHTPSLQALIIDAASDVTKISPASEALMFGIYCISIFSLGHEECQNSFGSPKDDLLRIYQFGCQQALLGCRYLRSADRGCLTALLFYLISVRPDTDPRSLSSMLAVAMRIAQRMGIHNESTFLKYNALEAEMCRRLWWSLVIFDNRICEMSDQKSTMLTPTWDCKSPLNINDFDILPEMRHLPVAHPQPTETLFTVVRSQLNDFVRHSAFHLDFTNPSLELIAENKFSGSLDSLENTMENEILKFCNPENPLHFMTIWTTRGSLARYRLLDYYSKRLGPSAQHIEVERNVPVVFALRILEYDTKLITSPLTKRYLWLIRLHFPFPAYVHLLQDLKKRPLEGHAEHVWEEISANYKAHFEKLGRRRNPLFHIFSKLVLQAWRAYEAANLRLEKPLKMPWIVSDLQNRLSQVAGTNGSEWESSRANPPIPLMTDLGDNHVGYGMDWQFSAAAGVEDYPGIFGQTPLEVDASQLDWGTVNWNANDT